MQEGRSRSGEFRIFYMPFYLRSSLSQNELCYSDLDIDRLLARSKSELPEIVSHVE